MRGRIFAAGSGRRSPSWAPCEAPPPPLPTPRWSGGPAGPAATGGERGPSLGGCPMFPATTRGTRRSTSLPVRPDSADVDREHQHQPAQDESAPRLRRAGGVRHPVQGGPGVAARRCAIHYTAYGDESDPGPFPIPGERAGRGWLGERRRPPRDRAAAGHVSSLRAGRRVLAGRPLECRRRASTGTSTRTRCGRWAGRRPTRPACRSSPGLVRYDEVAAGHIDHAVRFTVREDAEGATSFPATHYASSSTNPALPPMGLRLRLQGELLHLAGYPRRVARDPEGAEDVRDDRRRQRIVVVHQRAPSTPAGTTTTSNQLKTVPGTAFEAVDTGPTHH